MPSIPSFGLAEVIITPPPGLTNTGRIRQFHTDTVTRLTAELNKVGKKATTAVKAGVEKTYTEGTGEIAASIKPVFRASRNGVSMTIQAGSSRDHIIYLTALAGRPSISPGHIIPPKPGRKLRFFWKNPLRGDGPGMYEFRHPVFWRTRRHTDIIKQVLDGYANEFVQTMIATHRSALVEFVSSSDMQATSRSARFSQR